MTEVKKQAIKKQGKKQKQKEYDPTKPVFNVKIKGFSVEYTQDIKEANDAFQSSHGHREMWAVESNGTSRLVRQALN